MADESNIPVPTHIDPKDINVKNEFGIYDIGLTAQPKPNRNYKQRPSKASNASNSQTKPPKPPKPPKQPKQPKQPKIPIPRFSLTSSLTDEFAPFEYEQSKILAEKIDDYMSKATEFDILSTIRYDPTLHPHPDSTEVVRPENFFLLPEHHQRLIFTTAFFGWDFDIPYDHLVQELIKTIGELNPLLSYKVRVLVKKDGILRIETYPVQPRLDLFSGLNNPEPLEGDPVYKVYIDTQVTMVSPFTSFKTTYRDHYNNARKRMLKNNGDLEEVLVYNSCNEVMEGSITNVAFRRNNKWITPSVSTGCLCGVVRHVLLMKKQIEEGIILKKSIEIGEKVLLFNGVNGVCMGQITEV